MGHLLRVAVLATCLSLVMAAVSVMRAQDPSVGRLVWRLRVISQRLTTPNLTPSAVRMLSALNICKINVVNCDYDELGDEDEDDDDDDDDEDLVFNSKCPLFEIV
ncbi:uncharacterized protein ssp7 isoform X2 [Procambarus clarkii]|uniref:uncharacterized protein ssp7 isoform X2 n=1 Tax=Procambarus clarkii TaxID=6728 RepID=UPI001E675238|nr:uncharacterized protein LOC123767759 isoform X2 [Procambarus clarkii]